MESDIIAGDESEGAVKSYDSNKQHGWVTLADGTDALFRIEALRYSGMQFINPGDLVRVKWIKRPKSKQIYEFLQVRPADI